MRKAIAMLGEVKESIINAYEIKTGLSRTKLSHLMDAETWMNAKKAVELGFADSVLQFDTPQASDLSALDSFIFSRQAVTNSFMQKLPQQQRKNPQGASVEALFHRLNLITH